MKKFDGAIFDPSKWQAFFEENFSNYTTVDDLDYRMNPTQLTRKWIPFAPWDDNYGWGSEQFLKNRVSLVPSGPNSKILRLSAVRVSQQDIDVFFGKPNYYQRTINFESGMIRIAPLSYLDLNPNPDPNDPEFDTGFRYGAFEIRARLPLANHPGVWPVVWLFSGQIEIDFMDNLKPQPAEVIQGGAIMWEDEPWNRLVAPYDYWIDQGLVPSGSIVSNYEFDKYYYEGDEVVHRGKLYKAKKFIRRAAFGNVCPKTEGDLNLAEGFNTYTVVWTPTEITFFLNGYKIYSNTREYTQQKVGTPFFIIGLQMAEWAKEWMTIGLEHPDYYMDIESVRVYKPIGYDVNQNTEDKYNFRFHDKTTLFNNLSPLIKDYTEKAVSDLILGHGDKKLYFRSDLNILHNFYFVDATKKWDVSSLNWNKRNVMGNVVLSPNLTEGRLFYRGSVNNNDNKCSVFSFFFDPNNNNPSTDPNALIDPSGWVNENLDPTYVIKNVAGDLVVVPDGQRVYYRNTNDSICYFEKDSSGAWKHYDIIISGALIHNVAGDVVLSPNIPQKIYYRGLDGHLWNLYVSGGIWKHEPLDYPYTISNVAGDLVHSPIAGQERIYYRGTDSKIYFFEFEGGVWTNKCLHTEAGIFIGIPTGDAQGFLVHSPTTQQLFYIDYEKRMCNFYFENGVWNHACLDWNIKNVAASKYVVLELGKIFYKGTDNRLHLFYYIKGVGNLSGRWYSRSLKHEGGDNVAGNIVVSSNGKPYYIGTDGKVWNYFEKWSGNYDLTDEEISLD